MATASRVNPQTEARIAKIGVLTDFSKESATALRYAASIAHAYNAEIVLAHAYIPAPLLFAAPDVTLVYQSMDDLRRGLEGELEGQAKSITVRGTKCSTMLCMGGPMELLAGLNGADMIVVGTTGKSGVRKATLGSTAETIFRSCTVPVLTVGPLCDRKDDLEFSIKTILYATDFSSGAEVALPYAVSIARHFDAEVVLLHVKDNKDADFSFERAMARETPLEKLHELAPDTPSTCVVGFGSAATAIVEEGNNRNADLIVIGARGAERFASVVSHFGGGTAYEVAAKACCPVLTIRRPRVEE